MLRTVIALILVTLAPPAAAQTAEKPLSTMLSDEEGEYLVDGSGMSLYLFKADTRGTDGKSPTSACNNAACTGTWPPLLSEAPAADGKLNESLLGTFQREDGATQVTFNGWPLYYYYEDARPGDILGDDIESFGEDWYLIGPHGNRPGRDADDD
jgi:predicted lipoprotein with Yx(FWY)xxD motif